jgi:hypothetical protein
VLESGYDVGRTEAYHAAHAAESGYQLSGTTASGQRYANGDSP